MQEICTRALQFVRSVRFGLASAGAISADGRQILLRREGFAMLWNRCDAETVGDALARPGTAVPVIGPPSPRLQCQPIPGATNAWLAVPGVEPADAGVYQLVALNASGAISHSATLTVLTRPPFPAPPPTGGS